MTTYILRAMLALVLLAAPAGLAFSADDCACCADGTHTCCADGDHAEGDCCSGGDCCADGACCAGHAEGGTCPMHADGATGAAHGAGHEAGHDAARHAMHHGSADGGHSCCGAGGTCPTRTGTATE